MTPGIGYRTKRGAAGEISLPGQGAASEAMSVHAAPRALVGMTEVVR
jgi:hypothetical protein